MQLSKKQKPFSQFFSSISKDKENLEHFEKKHDPHRQCISEITNSEKCSKINV